MTVKPNDLHLVGKNIIESRSYVGGWEEQEHDSAVCYQAAKRIEYLEMENKQKEESRTLEMNMQNKLTMENQTLRILAKALVDEIESVGFACNYSPNFESLRDFLNGGDNQ